MNDTWLFLILIVVVAAGIAVVAFLKKSWDKKSAAQGFESNPLFNRIAEAARTAQPTHVVVTADGVTLLNSSDAFMLSEGGELTKLPQGRVKDVRDLNSWDNAVLKRFSTRIVSADGTCLTYFDFAQEGYRRLNFEYLGYFADTLRKEMGGDYVVLPCQLLIEDADPTLIGIRVTGDTASPMYSHDAEITELFGSHCLVRRDLAGNVPTVQQVVDQYSPQAKSWF